MTEPAFDPVLDYAEKGVAGEHIVGEYVRLSLERHLRDLEEGADRGLAWDLAAAWRVIRFIESLPHIKGRWAGTRIKLEPSQRFYLGCVFGWKRNYTDEELEQLDDLDPGRDLDDVRRWPRRFGTAYIEIPRKNAKTTAAAGVALYCSFADKEPGAEGYVAATKRDQAKICWNIARQMVLRTPDLHRRLDINKSSANISHEPSASFLEALGSREDTLDGLSPHVAVIDELHAHKTGAVVELMDTGQGARMQPLLFEITTAGFSKESVCRRHHERSVKILKGQFEADDWFAYIATIDEDDSWDDPVAWQKANPLWGTAVSRRFMEKQAKKAAQMPSFLNTFKRLHLNVWTQQETRWIPMDMWEQGSALIDEAELEGRPCYCGLDLARVRDLSAFLMIFPPETEGENWKVIHRYWVPEEDIVVRSRDAGVPYDAWRQDGYLIATPGNTTDFRFISNEILELNRRFDILEIAYDRAFAGEIIQTLQDEEITLVDFPQGPLSMDPGVCAVERWLLAGQLQHGAHPVTTWCIDNAVIREDSNANRKIDKQKSEEKVDGAVALVMAAARAEACEGGEKPSVYEEREMVVL